MATKTELTRAAHALLLPILKTQGFSADKLVFHKTGASGVAPLISLDLDSKTKASFKVHVGVEVRSPGSPRRPGDKGFAAHRLLSRGGVTQSDCTWPCDTSERMSRSLEGVLAALQAHGLPWIAGLATLDDVLKEVPENYSVARTQLALEAGDAARAREFILQGLERLQPLAAEPWAAADIAELKRLEQSLD
ncbi:MAG: hypothetical protein KF878_20495 [Planctomycetes bacterium]|nr:hypothetical protein [Planctomycetota bacterium]